MLFRCGAWFAQSRELRGWCGETMPRHPALLIGALAKNQSFVSDTMNTTEIAEMRGQIVRWDGKHGVIKTDAGIEVHFFPVHLAANGYTNRVKAGDRIAFRCEVISTRTYCLDLIRAVAVS